MTNWFDEIAPMFRKELLELARRRSYWLLRVSYALAVLGLVWIAWSQYDGQTGLRVLSQIAGMTFAEVAALQYLAVHLLAPVFLCGAIADERKSGSLDLLLTTPLTDRAIVVGKLISRLSVVVVVVVSGLPALAVVSLWGAFTPGMVVALEIATLAAGFFVASLAAFYSTTCATSLRAMVYTYAILVGLFASFVYWWISPAALLLVAFVEASAILGPVWTPIYAAGCVVGTICLSLLLLRSACRRLRNPVRAGEREAVANLHRSLAERPFKGREVDTLDNLELKRLRREVTKHVVDVDKRRSPFDFSDRPEVGCIVALAFNFLALAMPFFMTGVLLEPNVWLSLLLAMATMPILWIATHTPYLDPKGGLRDPLLATPLEGHEILAIIARRWRRSLMWTVGMILVAQALVAVFHPIPAILLMATEALLAVNLVVLSATCMLASPARSRAFFFSAATLCLAIGIGWVLGAFVVKGLDPISWIIVGSVAAVLLAVYRGDATARAAGNWYARYVACIAVAVAPAIWFGPSSATNRGNAMRFDWLGMTTPLALAFDLMENRSEPTPARRVVVSPGAKTIASDDGNRDNYGEASRFEGAIVRSLPMLFAFWIGLAANAWLGWCHLAKNFDRFVDRPTPRIVRGERIANHSAAPMESNEDA